MRPWLGRALALGFGSALALGGGELLLRVRPLPGAMREHFAPGIYVPHPELGWSLRPSYRGRLVRLGAEVPISTNALGYRGALWPAGEERAGLRVLALGDSCTFGLGVGDAETYPVALQAALRARDPSAEVFNAGVPGYDTGQEARVLRQLGPRLHPNAVVLAWLPNDVLQRSIDDIPNLQVIDGYLVTDPKSYREWRLSVDGRGLRRSALFLFAATRVKQLRLWFKGRTEREAALHVKPGALRYSEEPLDDIWRQTQALGARMVLVLFPRKPELSEPDADLSHHDAIAAFARERGIEVVHLPRLWRERPAASRWYLGEDQVHLTPEGYAEVARELAATDALRPSTELSALPPEPLAGAAR